MLSNCQMIQNYGAVLAQKFGDPGVCITHMHTDDGNTVIGIIDSFNHTTFKFPDGTVQTVEDVTSISDIFKAAKRLIQIPIINLDVEFNIAGKSYFRHLPGRPTNPEVLATAYRSIVKELLNGTSV